MFIVPTFRPALAVLALAFGLAGGAVPLAGVVSLALLPSGAIAAVVDAERITRLTEAMALGPMLAVIREEGLAKGADMDQGMLAGAGGVSWQAEVARIYASGPARKAVEAGLLAALGGASGDLAAMEDFFASDLGRKVALLEVEARRAFLDPEVVEAAKVAWADLEAAEHPRAAQVARIVRLTDAIELNLQANMTSSLAFYRGLREGGGLTAPLSDGEVASDLAARSDQIGSEIGAWIHPYLVMAYQPLSDDELAAYAEFLDSPAGQTLNAAVFQAFDALFAQISHDLGLGLSRRLIGQDI